MQIKDYNLIELTKQTFQKYFQDPMSDETAEYIQKSLLDFFELLLDWQKQDELEKKEVSNDI